MQPVDVVKRHVRGARGGWGVLTRPAEHDHVARDHELGVGDRAVVLVDVQLVEAERVLQPADRGFGIAIAEGWEDGLGHADAASDGSAGVAMTTGAARPLGETRPGRWPRRPPRR